MVPIPPRVVGSGRRVGSSGTMEFCRREERAGDAGIPLLLLNLVWSLMEISGGGCACCW